MFLKYVVPPLIRLSRFTIYRIAAYSTSECIAIYWLQIPDTVHMVTDFTTLGLF